MNVQGIDLDDVKVRMEGREVWEEERGGVFLCSSLKIDDLW